MSALTVLLVYYFICVFHCTLQLAVSPHLTDLQMETLLQVSLAAEETTPVTGHKAILFCSRFCGPDVRTGYNRGTLPLL